MSGVGRPSPKSGRSGIDPNADLFGPFIKCLALKRSGTASFRSEDWDSGHSRWQPDTSASRLKAAFRKVIISRQKRTWSMMSWRGGNVVGIRQPAPVLYPEKAGS